MVNQNTDADIQEPDPSTPLDELGSEDATQAFLAAQEEPVEPDQQGEPDIAVAPQPEPVPSVEGEAPPSQGPPVPVAPPPPTAADAHRLADLERQVKGYEANQANQYLADEARQYQQQLIQQGQDDQSAATIAQQHYQSRMEAWQHFQARNEMAVAQMQRLDTATRLADAHGVPARDLIRLGSEAEMEREALRQKEISDLKNQVAALEKGKVRPQQLDSGVSGPAAVSSYEEDLDRYNEGATDAAAMAAGRRAAGM